MRRSLPGLPACLPGGGALEGAVCLGSSRGRPRSRTCPAHASAARCAVQSCIAQATQCASAAARADPCRLWAALLATLDAAATPPQPQPPLGGQGTAGGRPAAAAPLPAGQLWALLQLHLVCLDPDEQQAHGRNVGDGAYLAGAGLAQLQPPSG